MEKKYKIGLAVALILGFAMYFFSPESANEHFAKRSQVDLEQLKEKQNAYLQQIVNKDNPKKNEEAPTQEVVIKNNPGQSRSIPIENNNSSKPLEVKEKQVFSETKPQIEMPTINVIAVDNQSFKSSSVEPKIENETIIYLDVTGFSLRFNLKNNMDRDSLQKFQAALNASCLSFDESVKSCSRIINSDPRLLVEMEKASETSTWLPTKLYLTCIDGSLNCLNAPDLQGLQIVNTDSTQYTPTSAISILKQRNLNRTPSAIISSPLHHVKKAYFLLPNQEPKAEGVK